MLGAPGTGKGTQGRRLAVAGSCPIDPDRRRACLRLQRQARLLFGVSLLGYSVALVVTFLLPALLYAVALLLPALLYRRRRGVA